MTEQIVTQDRAVLALAPHNKTIESLRRGVAVLGGLLDSIKTVKDESDLALASDLANKADTAAKLSRSIYTRAKQPLVDDIDRILAMVAPLAADFERVKEEAKARAGVYLKEKREEKARLDAEKLAKEAEARAALAEAERLAAAATTPEQRRVADEAHATAFSQAAKAELPALRGATTSSGSLFERVFWNWEVETEDDIPAEYTRRVPNAAKIEAAIEAGARQMPGIRIFQDQSMTARPKKKRS